MTTVALVTGSNKGLGLETSRQLARLGHTTYLGARSLEKAERAALLLRQEHLEVCPLQLDVTNADHIAAAVEKIDRDFGHLDILINNAGILRDKDWLVNRTSITAGEALRATFDVNFFAVVALTQSMLPLLRKSPAARIVNVSSILGSLALHSTPGSPIYATKGFAYDTSKAALNSFTIHLAHELRGTDIKVNSAHPGWVKTDMGTHAAPLSVADGVRTAVILATLPPDGPTGGFFHQGEIIPW